MFKTPKQIIISLIIGNIQKTIFLELKFEYSGLYDIILDKEYQGEVRWMHGNHWRVNTFKGSIISEEHYGAIEDAVKNSINRNS